MTYSWNDIFGIYTNKVGTFISDGYQINVESMGGSQGEDARIDLVKDGIVKRVIIDKKYNMTIGNYIFIQVISFNYNEGQYIYWNDRGQVDSTLYFIKDVNDRFKLIPDDDSFDKFIAKIKEQD